MNSDLSEDSNASTNDVFDESAVEQLCQPRAFPHAVESITRRQTHISWLILTGSYVYKIKRPVNLGFLDFSTLEKRRYFCAEEVRLNRRFTPDLYIGVVPITCNEGQFMVEGEGKVVEYAVKMRQFDERDLLQRMALEGRLNKALARDLGELLGRVHGELPHHHANLSEDDEAGTPASIFDAMAQNFAQICPFLTDQHALDRIVAIERWFRREYELLAPYLFSRFEEGFVRECHGDLHLGNITLIEGRLTLFDCIEFNRDFRLVDVFCELAFLVMDLERHELPIQANAVLNGYLEESGDYGGLRVLNFFRTYAAIVRAKVALMTAEDKQPGTGQLSPGYNCYLDLAESYAQTGPTPPKLVLMCGVSGSGKSTAAEVAAENLEGIRVRSDVERRRILGRASNPFGYPVHPSEGAYSSSTTRQTYARLEAIATVVVKAGFSCIVDATFNQQVTRADFIRPGQALGVPIVVIYCYASIGQLEHRIRERASHGADPSEATVDVLRQQLENFERPDTSEQYTLISIDTECSDWRQQVIDATK